MNCLWANTHPRGCVYSSWMYRLSVCGVRHMNKSTAGWLLNYGFVGEARNVVAVVTSGEDTEREKKNEQGKQFDFHIVRYNLAPHM